MTPVTACSSPADQWQAGSKTVCAVNYGVKITHGTAILTDEPRATRNPEGFLISHSPVHADSPLDTAIAHCFSRLSRTGSARVTRIAIVTLGDYPEGAVLPDSDMMATLAVPAGPGTAFVSFPPEQALSLIKVWSDVASSGAEALGCYRHGTRALAEAALGALGFEAGDLDALEEDALVATLLATHAPLDTSVLTAEIRIALDEGECIGVFVLLADAKALASLVEKPPA